MVKNNVLNNDLQIQGDGVYAIYPFSKFDKDGKGAFKIGIATKGFYHRLEQNYRTYFPMGFYYKSFLQNPNRLQENKSKLAYYRGIEKYILDNIKREHIKSNARIIKDGQTEWIYTDQDSIDKVFKKANVVYGGNLKNYKITKSGFEKETKNKKVIFEGVIKFVYR
jgi:hypothetical protein